MGDELENGQISQQDMELVEVLESLGTKNKQLQSCLNHHNEETERYKRRCEVLEQILIRMTKSLEENAQVFYQLFDETKSALQMARIPFINVSACVRTPPKKREIVEKEDVNKPGPSEVQPRKKINLERLNLQELRFNLEELDTIGDEGVENSLRNRPLSTIAEENSHLSSTKDAYVLLTPLPFSVISSHLRKSELSTSSSDDSTLFESSGIVFESTPNKLDHMRRLGLSPVNILKHQNNNFVNTRRRINNNETNGNNCQEMESVKRRNNNETEANNSPETKIKKEGETQGRPKRKARPKHLKEVSLKKKMRKNF